MKEKFKVKIIKKSNKTFLYINGTQYGCGIHGYKIEQEGIDKPILTLKIHCDELDFECEETIVQQEKE